MTMPTSRANIMLSGASPRAGRFRLFRRMAAMALTGALVMTLAGVVGIPAAPIQTAAADTPEMPETVGSEVLPTPQINGVVWSLAVRGDTAYAVGSFTKARPQGVNEGGAGEVVRNNAMAFTISTGKILPWNPSLNAQARAVELSPDKEQLIVGGDFTTIDGTPRSKIAAFNLPSGSLTSGFNISVGGQVNTIAVTTDDIYFGGSFQTVSGQERTNVAKLSRSTRNMANWKPYTDDIVEGLIATDSSKRVIIGGRFQNLNHEDQIGVGAVDETTAASLPWSSTPTPARVDNNRRSWVVRMVLEDGVIYAANNGQGGHWFDGRWAADYETGDLVWLDNCYGSTSDISVMDKTVYSVSHSHDCSSLGEFPEENPQVWKRALAETTLATGTDKAPPSQNSKYSGQPIPSLLHWYPALNTGFYTNQYQGGWALDNNGKYLVSGGEFTRVNGKNQQGLAVYATRDTASTNRRPEYTPQLKPSLLPLPGNTVRIAWPSTWDYDDETLTYEVLRDHSLTAIGTVEAPSTWWEQKSLGFRDDGVAAGSTHTYRIRVSDPAGNEYIGPRSDPVTVTQGMTNPYGEIIRDAGAEHYYPLDETEGRLAYDHAGFDDAQTSGDLSRGREGAVADNTASGFNGVSAATGAANPAPDEFSTQLWFKTTTTGGGKLIGYGNSKTGKSGSYDRHVWMGNDGRLHFGTWIGHAATVSSEASYNDGEWHQMTASLGENGMALHIDGLPVAERSDVTSGQAYTGYWRIGGDNMSGWPEAPSKANFTGDLDEVAIYPVPLSDETVLAQYTASGRTADIPEPPVDAYGLAVFNDDPSLYWRLDEDGDRDTALDSSGHKNNGSMNSAVETGADGVGAWGGHAMGFGTENAAVVAKNAVQNPRTYSLEAWFKTDGTTGGKIIGFGSADAGLSKHYDRHVYMRDDGRLVFGVYTGSENTITTDEDYNDDAWHQVVATQSADGMKLYVDGSLQGSDPQADAEDYKGYWRIGGDTNWGGASRAWFTGTIDEAAVYPRALSAKQVGEHYSLIGGANEKPTASFTTTVEGLAVVADGTGSTDSDGTITSYEWTFGDGSSATGEAAQHEYAKAGTYTVGLTVTDDRGATDNTTSEVAVTVPDQEPTAEFTVETTGLKTMVDGSASADSNGEITRYAWDFGDGNSGAGVTAAHTYAKDGSYDIELTVTDEAGQTAARQRTVTVANASPTAAIAHTINGMSVSFDGAQSADADGSIESFDWDFGDGKTGTGEQADHEYATAGTYTVMLKATDDLGATGTAEVEVEVSAPQGAAVFETNVSGRGADFDASASTVGTGTIESYTWDFGDGEAGTGKTTSHRYAKDGTYTVILTVASDDGSTARAEQVIEVAHLVPTASFSLETNGSQVSVDAAESSDPDDRELEYAWDFGDSKNASGVQVTHEYVEEGEYEITLTVTDADGETATMVQTATIEGDSLPEPKAFVTDSFDRQSSSGWGSADSGGTWTTAGSSSYFTVAGGLGKISMPSPGSGRQSYLGRGWDELEYRMLVGNDKKATGGGIYHYAVLRNVPGAGSYRAKIRFRSDDTVAASLEKIVGGSASQVTPETTIAGLEATPDGQLQLRVQVLSDRGTRMQLKLWDPAGEEPDTWQINATDDTAALQQKGGIGYGVYLSGSATNEPVVAQLDDLWVGEVTP